MITLTNCISLSCFLTKIVLCMRISHVCYMFHPFHLPWFDYPNIWWRVQVLKPLWTDSYHFLPPKSKYIYSSAPFVNTLNLYLLFNLTKFHTKNRQNYSLTQFNLYIFML
jgi:hypothetical protein